jgi:hypothetical protein
MDSLLSKLQYRNFEPGEFVESRFRNFEETIGLIDNFPWSREREKIVIDLTNPSVTLERNATFLKLSLYFNGKFVLYYLNPENILFAKSFTDITDAYPYIRAFFRETDFTTTDFKQENTWLKNNLVHFVSQDFRYQVTRRRIRQFLISSSGVPLLLFFSVNLLFLLPSDYALSGWKWIVLIAVLMVWGGGINLLLFLQYYLHTRNRILILSRGNDQFIYGHRSDPVAYQKKQISEISLVHYSNGRSPILGFAVLWIRFQDQRTIQIPTLLLGLVDMQNKFPGIPIKEENALPVMRKDP